MCHRTGYLTGPAANALFSIALHKWAELFRSQFRAPKTGIALVFRYFDLAAEVTARVFLRNSSDTVLLPWQTILSHICH
jgi:hypothetical protein